MDILEIDKIKIPIDDYISQLDLTKLSDEDLNKLCRYKLSRLNISKRYRQLFIRFVITIPFSRKHTYVILKRLKGKLFIPYIYRHILKTAYDNEVPKSVINNYILSKKSYDRAIKYKGTSNDFLARAKNELERNFYLLHNCTLEMISRNNTRKEKIYKILLRNNSNEKKDEN